MKKKFIDYFMIVAEETAKLSHAVRLKVGAVIVKDDRIISIGYNGMPAGWDNVCEEWVEVHDIFSDADKELTTRAEVLHAESNAIAKLARSTESGDGATMFCTHAPCLQCAKLIYQSGIRELYFKTHYRDETGLTFLKNSTIQVHGH
jgi:dCMP deaminase